MEWVIQTPPAGHSINGATTPTGRTILMLVNGDANVSAVIKEIGISFGGVTATNSPVIVELVKSSQATNGTLGTVYTPVQWRGQGNTSGAGLTSKLNGYSGYVSEPTVLTSLQSWMISPTTGVVYPLPLGDEPEVIAGSASMGLGIRVTPAQSVDVNAYIRFVQGLT